ncbi:MAG: DUF1697 domain-containing protein [Sandaracinus sp.]
MTRLVALLRAVNVGRTGKLPMEALRARAEEIGATNVSTFIASGNLLCDTRKTPAAFARALEAALLAQDGLDTLVVTRTPEEIAHVAAHHAFADRAEPGPCLHVAFLDAAPAPKSIEKIDPSRSPGDEVALRGRELHLFLPNGAGPSKLDMKYLERCLGVRGTMRNQRTVVKLAALAARSPSPRG